VSEYLTSSQVARSLGLTVVRIHQLANAGRLRVAARAGQIRLFDPADVEAFAVARRSRNAA
jgi:DNA-binding transcriptional MerR regulator